MSRHRRGHQISCVWHPEAKGEVLYTQNLGCIRVCVGPAKYQLSTAEIVEI